MKGKGANSRNGGGTVLLKIIQEYSDSSTLKVTLKKKSHIKDVKSMRGGDSL